MVSTLSGDRGEKLALFGKRFKFVLGEKSVYFDSCVFIAFI